MVKLNVVMEQRVVAKSKIAYDNIKPVPAPQSSGYQDQMKDVKTTGIKVRGAGAAKKGFTARGPMG